MHTVVLLAAACAATVTDIPQFTGDISESWQGFQNYMFNPDFYEQSPARIFGGKATIANPLMVIYEPGFAEFGLGSLGPVRPGRQRHQGDGSQRRRSDRGDRIRHARHRVRRLVGRDDRRQFPRSQHDLRVVPRRRGCRDRFAELRLQPQRTVRRRREVGSNDFLDLIAAWGPSPGHRADPDGDDIVGISDFLQLLANWGPCPV